MRTTTALMQRGLPIRVFIFLPFILLVLIMVGVTATVALRAAAVDCGPAGGQPAPGNLRQRAHAAR